MGKSARSVELLVDEDDDDDEDDEEVVEVVMTVTSWSIRGRYVEKCIDGKS